jgi:hypothetical protein
VNSWFLPPLPWVSDWRQTLSKLLLLTLSISFLVRLTRLLFRTGAGTGTA